MDLPFLENLIASPPRGSCFWPKYLPLHSKNFLYIFDNVWKAQKLTKVIDIRAIIFHKRLKEKEHFSIIQKQ